MRIIVRYFPDPEPSEHSLDEGGISLRSPRDPFFVDFKLLVRTYFMTLIQLQLTYQQLNVDDVISRFDGVQVIHPKEEGHFSG